MNTKATSAPVHEYEATRQIRQGHIHYKITYNEEHSWAITITWPVDNIRITTLGMLSYAELKGIETMGKMHHWPHEFMTLLYEETDKRLSDVLQRLQQSSNKERSYLHAHFA